jgi:ribosomal protein S18 acetylase RimI-like enzyme
MIKVTRLSAQDDLNKVILNIQKASWVKASEILSEDYSVGNLNLFLENVDNVFIVAYSDELFAGMASAKLMNKPNGDIWLYIDEVDVCEDKLRQRIGTALISYLLNFAQVSGCHEVWLGTEVDNIPANALYTSLDPSEIQNFIGYTYALK